MPRMNLCASQNCVKLRVRISAAFSAACGPNIRNCRKILRCGSRLTPHQRFSKKRSLTVRGRTKFTTKIKFVHQYFFFVSSAVPPKSPHAPHTKPIWIKFFKLWHMHRITQSLNGFVYDWWPFPSPFLLHRSIAFRRARSNSSTNNKPSLPFNSIN